MANDFTACLTSGRIGEAYLRAAPAQSVIHPRIRAAAVSTNRLLQYVESGLRVRLKVGEAIARTDAFCRAAARRGLRALPSSWQGRTGRAGSPVPAAARQSVPDVAITSPTFDHAPALSRSSRRLAKGFRFS